jgi:hypothetical protein
VDDQYQTKVESASKYRVRLSGIVLMNLASNQGVVDSIDLPTLAYGEAPGGSGGSFGATLRQSEIGFEAFGPTVAGARTTADLQLDLAGGFPPVPNGINSGLVRLRTATMRMDWTNTSVVVGQDAIFFSPARRHRSLCWRFRRSPMRGICGAGCRRSEWNIGLRSAKSRA